MRRFCWRPGAVLLVLLAATGRAAPPPDAAQLRREIRVLQAFRALGLTQAQAQTILTAAAKVRAANAEIERAQETFYEQTRETIVAIEWAMIRNERIDERSQQTIERYRSRYRRAVDDAESALKRSLSDIDEALTPAQQALLEPPEVEAQRVAAEQAARRQLEDALRQALTDLTLWVPNAQGSAFGDELAARITAVLNLAYPNAPAESLAPYRTKLQGLYTQVRQMSASDLDLFRDELGPQLRAALPVAQPTATDTRYVLSRKEWVAVWRGDTGYRLLLAILKTLPAGEAR